MFKIRTFNQIATPGLKVFSPDKYEVGANTSGSNGILLRSHKLSDDDITPGLHAVARAGAGYNNIPVDECSAKGVVVFNTPGANANSVKELVLASLLNASRGIVSGNAFVRSLGDLQDAADLHKIIEGKKKLFKGREIAGKTLGIVGLGSIGMQVATAALRLDMQVLGYDPALSVDAAWRIPSEVKRMDNMNAMLGRSDYLTLHVPLLESTKALINAESLKSFKRGAVLLNFSRDAIVDATAVVGALEQGVLSSYFADFPEPVLLGRDDVFLTPHLGASTTEAEVNCAIMAARQLCNFLEHGNIRNSVNFPLVYLERTEGPRFSVTNKNIPTMLGQIMSVLAKHKVNIIDVLNKSKADIAYNLIDIETPLTDTQIKEILNIEGVINLRCL